MRAYLHHVQQCVREPSDLTEIIYISKRFAHPFNMLI